MHSTRIAALRRTTLVFFAAALLVAAVGLKSAFGHHRHSMATWSDGIDDDAGEIIATSGEDRTSIAIAVELAAHSSFVTLPSVGPNLGPTAREPRRFIAFGVPLKIPPERAALHGESSDPH